MAISVTDVPRIAPHTLKAWLRDSGELAVIDVREEGVFSRGHLLLAANLPLWRLELLVRAAVPRLATRIVLVDGDGRLVPHAVRKLAAMGYRQLHVLDGGTPAWAEAGYPLYTGVYVPSKAFGELVEEAFHTPHIGVAELQARQARGERLVIVDGRTPEEFTRFSLPGAHSLPNGELPWRIRELVPDPDTLVVVNCAGRTRSIIGAQTLVDAGLPNPVVALENGTMAWLQSGQALRQGAPADLPEPAEVPPGAAGRARALAGRLGVITVNAHELAELAGDASRTLYRFDTRTREEYEAGHLPGWRWAPGGQLIQATDAYLATRGARVVIADWDGVRGPTTAAWLARLGGFEVFLHTPDPGGALEAGPEPQPVWQFDDGQPVWLAPRQAQQLLEAGRAVLFDVESSLAYAARHPAPARFVAPDRLPEFVADLPADTTVVITSSDGRLARHVAVELRHHQARPTRALQGGSQAWFAAGLPAAQGRDGILTGDDDDWYSPYVYPTEAERLARFREYLDWETGLARRVREEGDLPARLET